jgi:VIT1/CCC1 family predicted Fe2+/Mn2+ transporter
VVAVSLIALAVLGYLGAEAGNAAPARSVIRVTFWGAIAIAVTAGIGRALGTVV